MTMTTRYDRSYHASRNTDTAHAARVVLDLLHPVYADGAVLDLGCGVGTWAAAASEHGARSVQAIDGPWVDSALLEVTQDRFRACDLERELPDAEGPFRLTIWAENAEHLSAERGTQVLDWVCNTSDAVLFSAAIPGQGGTGHRNERWQSAWAADFERHGFRVADVVRPAIWSDARVPYWYKQNMLLYYRPDRVSAAEQLDAATAEPAYLDLVHPAKWTITVEKGPGVRRSLGLLLRSLKHAMAKRLPRAHS